jgi:hypothetical protein
MARKAVAYLRRHHVALLALFFALSGTAYAATLPRNSVGTAQLKRDAVTSSKIKDRSLLARDFKPGELRGARGAPGTQGPSGARGPSGPAGANGPPGADGSALAAGVVWPITGSVGFIGGTQFGFASVRRTSAGHYCVSLESGLRQYANLLAIAVSAIKPTVSAVITGTPIAYQEQSQVGVACQFDEIAIVTEVLSGGTAAASDDVPFALIAN